jgi:hypothetical protein
MIAADEYKEVLTISGAQPRGKTTEAGRDAGALIL